MELNTEDNQWYEFDFKMQRIPNEPKEKGRPARLDPVTRYFESSKPPAPKKVRARPARPGIGPDLSLRPDLAPHGAARDPRAASLSLRVEPDNATVYLDGAFLGAAALLGDLEMAVKPGRHTIEVLAPGLAPETRVFDIGADEAIELELVLQNE